MILFQYLPPNTLTCGKISTIDTRWGPAVLSWSIKKTKSSTIYIRGISPRNSPEIYQNFFHKSPRNPQKFPRNPRSLFPQAAFISRLGELARSACVVLTVCTGSLLLAATKLLDGVKATTNKVAVFVWSLWEGCSRNGGFYGIWWWFHGNSWRFYGDLMGIHGDFMVI